MTPDEPLTVDGTLFHFTKTYENLIGILEHDFKPRYCLENLRLSANGGKAVEDQWAIPMVCICDLRLSQIRDHLEEYGGYGIGLTKTWGARNGLSPLIYLHSGSYSSELIGRAIEHLRNLRELEDVSDSSRSTALITALELVAMTKPYEGVSPKTDRNRRFYDEREWRYLPHLKQLDGQPDHLKVLSADEFANAATRDEMIDAIATLCPLQFNPTDIVYLFVKDDQEIVPLVERIRNIKRQYVEQDVTLLTTRIMSSSRIPLDF